MTERSEIRSRIATAALFLTLAAGLALGAFLPGCSGVSEANVAAAAEEKASVTTAVVSLRSIPDTALATGTVIADRSSLVAADAAGKVIAVYVDRGDRVVQGQPLVRLDVRGAMLGAREARAQRAAAESEARLASAERERSQALFDKGAITRAQYDREMAVHTSTREQVEAAAARVGLANKAVGDGVVRAPYSGVVAERMVQVGEYVRADSRLVSLVDPEPLKLELTVPEALIGRIAIGRSLQFSAAALPGQTFAARIDVVGPSVDLAGRSLVVEALVEGAAAGATAAAGTTKAPGTSAAAGSTKASGTGAAAGASPSGTVGLLPGMFVTAYIETGSRQLPVVPRSALRRAGTTWRIFAVVNGALEERIVQLADSTASPDGSEVALLGGVAAGDRIVAPAGEKLRDGLRIQ